MSSELSAFKAEHISVFLSEGCKTQKAKSRQSLGWILFYFLFLILFWGTLCKFVARSMLRCLTDRLSHIFQLLYSHYLSIILYGLDSLKSQWSDLKTPWKFLLWKSRLKREDGIVTTRRISEVKTLITDIPLLSPPCKFFSRYVINMAASGKCSGRRIGLGTSVNWSACGCGLLFHLRTIAPP